MLAQDILFTVVYILTYSLDNCAGRDHSVRTTKYGKVKGIVDKIHGHQKIEKFLGIPYARAPVGNLRLEVSRIYFQTKPKIIRDFVVPVPLTLVLSKSSVRWVPVKRVSIQTLYINVTFMWCVNKNFRFSPFRVFFCSSSKVWFYTRGSSTAMLWLVTGLLMGPVSTFGELIQVNL